MQEPALLSTRTRLGKKPEAEETATPLRISFEDNAPRPLRSWPQKASVKEVGDLHFRLHLATFTGAFTTAVLLLGTGRHKPSAPRIHLSGGGMYRVPERKAEPSRPCRKSGESPAVRIEVGIETAGAKWTVAFPEASTDHALPLSSLCSSAVVKEFAWDAAHLLRNSQLPQATTTRTQTSNKAAPKRRRFACL